MRNKFVGAVVLTALAATAGYLIAGPLNPGGGPIASTYKTLTEVEPRVAVSAANTPGDVNSLFKITQPGSYYLTGNVTGTSGKFGIEIDASGVTLDLNGFTLTGVSGSLAGIAADSARSDITVLNGHVKNWGGAGVDLSLGSSNACLHRVMASSNGSTGIVVPPASVVRECTARANATVGISAGNGSTISDCAANQNGTYGFSAPTAATIVRCSATDNTRIGISADYGATISDCTAWQNGWDGIVVYFGGTVTRCAARLNTQNGIEATAGCAILDCTASDNVLDGITVGLSNTVRGNTCYSNGTVDTVVAGIHALSTNNRIEGNTCTSNDFGIDVDGAGNIIVRNTCADNTQNFVLVANNVHGPIVDRTAPGSPAVVGNTAAGTMGTTDHNANYAY